MDVVTFTPPQELYSSSAYISRSPHISVASHELALRRSSYFWGHWASRELEMLVHALDGGKAKLLVRLESILRALAMR